MVELLTLAAGVLIGSLLGVAMTALLAGSDRDHAQGLTFADVCRAAVRAKEERMDTEARTRDYVDGADGVLAELLEEGYGDSPEEMETAYRAGGGKAVIAETPDEDPRGGS